MKQSRVRKPELNAPSLQSKEGHLQTSMEVWVENITTTTAKTPVRKRSYYLQWKIVLIVHAASHQVHFKAGKTQFFKRNPISNKEDQDDDLRASTFTTDLVMGAIMSC